MAEDREKCAVILKALKFSQRGLTITDISRKTSLNRNNTAQQLEILLAEGRVDVRKVGSARVYSLAQRVPLSAFLCFTRNMILILDNDLTVVQVNDQYTVLAGVTKQELIGHNILELPLPIVSSPEALTIIRSTEKEQVMADIRFQKGKKEMFFKMEVIPTTFDSGDTGLTIVLEDITEKKWHLKNMEFLARTAMELVDLPPDTDIYQYIAERIMELLPENPRLYIHSYDEVKGQFYMRVLAGEAPRRGAADLAGFDLVGMKFPVASFFYGAPFFETPSTFKNMREMRFRPFYEEEQISFYQSCAQQFPPEVCDAFLRTFNIAKIYLVGLVWQEQLFGLVGIFMGRDEELENKQAIESFLRQVSIAISRRMTEERLSRSERRFSELAAMLRVPTIIMDNNGHVSLINPQFSEMSGYTLEDIPTREAFFEKAFPDPEYRKGVVLAMNTEPGGEHPKTTYTMQCRDKKQKQVVPSPVLFSDGTQILTFEPEHTPPPAAR